jgi:predicted RecA/RadA family phage recombinase
MPAEILAVNTTAADSADIVVAAGDILTVALKDAAGPKVEAGCNVLIFLKDDAGQYFQIGALDYVNRCLVITGPGTYRFSRLAGGSCGVFSG